jgi:peptidyl-prolyl cis-trans isomerase D
MMHPALDYHPPFARSSTGETSMLNVMRDNLKHLKWVLVVVALAMLGYLGSYFDPRVGRGAESSEWAARVDGQAISTQEFLQTARLQDDYYRRLLGAQYEPMKKNLKLGSQAIQSLVDRQLVLAEARSLGLAATKAEISKAILEDPNFKDPSGVFVGKERYQDYIGQNFDGGVPAYERRVGEDILAKEWLQVMTASARISPAEVEQAWRTRNVRAAVDYVFVPTSSVTFDTNVDAAARASWYASHADDYKRSESRKVRLVVVDRQAQVANAKVLDADVKADYDAHEAEYARPDQRRARHILFKLPAGGSDADKAAARAAAESVLKRAQNGEDFAAMARSLSQDPVSAAQGGELGWFARGAMVKAFDDAAFATAPGQFAPVVESEFGFHVIQVEEARAAGSTPLSDVADSIRHRLELQRAQDLAAAEAQRLAGQLKTAADLDALATKSGLKVEERLVSADDPATDLGPSPEFIRAVGALQPGQVSAPLGVARGLALVACVEIVPAAARPLAEVESQVTKDVLNDRGIQAARVAARRVAASPTLADGAKSMKLEVKKSGDLGAGGNLAGLGPVPELDTVLFAAGSAVGTKGSVAAQGGAIAFEITRHDTFDPAKFEADRAALREDLLRQRRDQLAQGLIENLRQSHTVEINQPLVDGVNG